MCPPIGRFHLVEADAPRPVRHPPPHGARNVTTAVFCCVVPDQTDPSIKSCRRSDDDVDFDADEWGDHRALTGRGWSTGFLQESHDSIEEGEEECKEDGESPSDRRRQNLRRRFYVGQWLDVKDTVNNWLEATVMDMTSSGERESEVESVLEKGRKQEDRQTATKEPRVLSASLVLFFPVCPRLGFRGPVHRVFGQRLLQEGIAFCF